MNAQQIALQVSENLQSIEKLKKEWSDKKHALDKEYSKKLHTPESMLHQLKQQYEDAAWEISQEHNECPSSRWGQPLRPTDIVVNEEGICLEWEDEHPYHASSYHYFTATWEQLYQYQQLNDE